MPPDVDQLIDTLAGLLRDFGRHSFDLERVEARKTQTLFDQWAQHLLTGIEAPGQAPAGGPRQHAALRAGFVAHRKQEQTEFTQSRDALRDVVWMFVSSVNREVVAERTEDATLSRSLSALGTTLQTAGTGDLRRLALEAVKQVHDVLDARRARQRKHVAELGERLEALGSQLEVARRDSTIDALTQLYNRRAFDEQLGRAAELAALREGGAALLMIDLDHFKQINDTRGHPCGDAVLKAVAHALVRVFKRRSDFLARFGGEELVALVRDVTPAEALTLGERAREAVASLTVGAEGGPVRVTVSCGVASWALGESGADWLARADAALYRAKAAGRNRVAT
ncbi:MAG: GGDEF domain-containing protein [Archangium sp.]|nr:GGDEF domain-containing protein [Archangium sp.]